MHQGLFWTQIKLDPVALASEVIQKDLQLNSASRDLKGKLSGNGDSQVIDRLIIPVGPDTPEFPPNYPMNENLSMIEPLLLCPAKRTPSSVEEFRAHYPCSCTPGAVVHPSKPTLLDCWDLSDPLVLGIPHRQSDSIILPLNALSANDAGEGSIPQSTDACEDQPFVNPHEALDAT